MALVTNPKLVILDEPTSALDVMTQANIMNLLKRLKRELGLTYIFITHDLALASELADRVAVMYGGRIAELGPADEVYPRPRHPYTKLLIESVPFLRYDKPPTFIPGTPPDLIDPPSGCRFHPRCPYFMKGKCDVAEPPMFRADGDHWASCWLLEERRDA
jgi:oligopeptide/dipeptide ABC transporter, ATP-binding protein, C-terminal domain